MNSNEIQMCYFCEYRSHSVMMNHYDDIWFCDSCDIGLPLKYNTCEPGECPVCYENKKLVGLPTCIHSICLQCCKTIYFGSTQNERPKSIEVALALLPDWPYDDDDDEAKQDEYNVYEDEKFNIEEKTYDELITIRNNLISERPEWMNTEEFINYENAKFKYYTEYQKAEEEWEKYNETKTKGNNKCPLCRRLAV